VSRSAALAAALAGLLMAVDEAGAEQLVVALSTNEVKINSSFTGTSITIFGAIERDASTVSRGTAYDIVALILGPPQTVVTRRKDRIVGIWANAASETMIAAPSFYAMSASNGVPQVTSPQLARELQIGFDNINLRGVGSAPDTGAAPEFREAFLRLKQEAGLYHEAPTGVDFIGESIFRTTAWVPANVPIGDYQVAVYLFSGATLLAHADDMISVSKTGVERFMFNVAHQQAALYGVVCVILAVFVGWLGGVIFRRD
jgi:uncharacterized protein (TIGR02186 family)